ncbi:MAG: protein kinase [Actinomycetota bacterium]
MSWGSPAEGSPGLTVAGTMLGDRYQLIAPIAAGGMARVWSARDVQLNRDVAVKILHPHLVNDDGFVARFRREAVASARLQHRSIVAVYDTISSPEIEAIVMELIDGQTLREVLDAKGALSAHEVADYGGQIAEALAVAHATGLVHRDIKPANIMVRGDGRVKVTDFGIAKAADDADLTSTGTLLGTAKYLSPEQVTGAPIDPRSDLYALGVVLFEALTGSVPFKENTDAATALARIREDAPPLTRLRPNVPGDLDRVVQRLMARELADRYAAASEVVQELAAVDLGSAPIVPPVDVAAQVAAGLRPPDPPRTAFPTGTQPMVQSSPPGIGTTGHPGAPGLGGGQPGTTGVGPGAAGVGTGGHPGAAGLGGGASGLAANAPGAPGDRWPAPTTPPIQSAGGAGNHGPVGGGPAYYSGGRDPSIELLGTQGGAAVPPGVAGVEHQSVTREQVRGSRWLPAIAMGVIVVLLAGVALSLAGVLPGISGGEANPFDADSSLPIVEATSFDPLTTDDLKLEREELVPFAFDGDLNTAWTSEPYRRRELGGLKDGVGLMLTLEESLPLNQVELETRSEDWQLDIYVGDEFGPDPAGWGVPAATIDAGSNRQVRDLGRVEGSKVLLWIRDTGESEAGRFQFVLTEVTIR